MPRISGIKDRRDINQKEIEWLYNMAKRKIPLAPDQARRFLAGAPPEKDLLLTLALMREIKTPEHESHESLMRVIKWMESLCGGSSH